MGFNTVAFLLNDCMHELEKSPKTLAFKLTHPPMGESDRFRLDNFVEEGEVRLNSQAIEVLPTFHADQTKFYLAGQNRIEEMKFMRFGTTKDGKKTITLELPDDFRPWGLYPIPKAWKHKP